jgi:hypothetical protein
LELPPEQHFGRHSPSAVKTVPPARFLFLQIGSPHDKRYEQCSRQNNAVYAKKHGYQFLHLSTPANGSVVLQQSFRFKVIPDLLESGEYDAIFYTDADAVMTDCAYTLHDKVPTDTPFAVSPDLDWVRRYYAGHWGSGLMVLQNDAGTVQCLRNTYAFVEQGDVERPDYPGNDMRALEKVRADGRCPVRHYHLMISRYESSWMDITSMPMLHAASRSLAWRDDHLCRRRCL